MIDSELAPELNAFRRELGLAPVRRIFGGYIRSPQLVLGLFDNWFAPTQPDWPSNLHLTGFVLYNLLPEYRNQPIPGSRVTRYIMFNWVARWHGLRLTDVPAAARLFSQPKGLLGDLHWARRLLRSPTFSPGVRYASGKIRVVG